jgi:CheY-like chemotaxis protein
MNNVTQPVVLVVEDEHLVRTVAVQAFLDHGFLVLEAEHAAQALSIHRANQPFHVLFTDVNMPGELNGIDLAERLKEACPGMHVIITSALPVLRSVDHLPATFFAKPYVLSEVCSAAVELMAA